MTAAATATAKHDIVLLAGDGIGPEVAAAARRVVDAAAGSAVRWIEGRAGLEASAAFLGQRKAFGAPLAEQQGLRFMLAEMAREVAAARA